MKQVEIRNARKPGRPLGFNRQGALRQAMLLFWRHGYESTSINDLIQAMRINPPSLYAAFGDKKQLFLEAVELYMAGPVTSASIIDEAPTSRQAAAELLRTAAAAFTGKLTPPGCLLASSAISCSPAAADVQRALARIRLTAEKRLKQKILRDQSAGLLPPELDAGALAGHVMAVIQGMSTLARDGATRNKLSAITAVALLAWPSPD